MSGERFLVVLDHMVDAQPALDRALQSVELTNGKLHLFKAAFYRNEEEKAAADEPVKHVILKEAGQQLLKLAAQAIDAGLEVSTEIVWAEDWGQAALDSVKRNDIYMVFKSSYIHSQIERRQDTLELALLRNCPCPVLLMHDNTQWDSRRVLAAVNLAATDEAHKQLNQKVLDIALTFKAAYDSEVHVVNAKSAESENIKATDDDSIFAGSTWRAQHNPVEKITLDEDYISEQCGGLDKQFIHLKEGAPVDVILAVAEEVKADLIIIGTVARTGIKSRLLGNMAENILDSTGCDVMALSEQEHKKKASFTPFA